VPFPPSWFCERFLLFIRNSAQVDQDLFCEFLCGFCFHPALSDCPCPFLDAQVLEEFSQSFVFPKGDCGLFTITAKTIPSFLLLFGFVSRFPPLIKEVRAHATRFSKGAFRPENESFLLFPQSSPVSILSSTLERLYASMPLPLEILGVTARF